MEGGGPLDLWKKDRNSGGGSWTEVIEQDDQEHWGKPPESLQFGPNLPARVTTPLLCSVRRPNVLLKAT